MNFLFDFTLFVIDIHQIMLISLFPTPFTFMGLADSYYGMILDCDLKVKESESDMLGIK